MFDKKDMNAKRRRSSTTSRLAAMVAGQSTTAVRRHRGSSYQAGDDVSLIPDNFTPRDHQDYHASANSKKKATGIRAHCTRDNICKLLGVVVVLFVVYLIFAMTFRSLHTEDPCIVARKNLKYVRSIKNDRENLGQDFKPELPKIIHQQWKTSKVSNEKYLKWQENWKRLFPEPEYTHMLWTDETQRELIKTHYQWFLSYYDGYQFDIQRADASRYFIMHHYGGVYADLDYEPLAEFWEHLPQDRVSLIESPYLYNELVQNSLMSSPKGDPFWEHAFEVLVSEHAKPVLSATGPVFLDTTIKTNKHPYHVLPCENFHRIPMGEHKNSPYLTLLHRELLGRLYPMKYCGNYADLTCQLGKHHNTATYLKDVGLFSLVFTSSSSTNKIGVPPKQP